VERKRGWRPRRKGRKGQTEGKHRGERYKAYSQAEERIEDREGDTKRKRDRGCKTDGDTEKDIEGKRQRKIDRREHLAIKAQNGKTELEIE
jgi:hypothetical protein